jgi:hypothetical protein
MNMHNKLCLLEKGTGYWWGLTYTFPVIATLAWASSCADQCSYNSDNKSMKLRAFFASTAELRIPKPRSDLDTSYGYYTELLHKALTKAAKGRPVPALLPTMDMEQDRAVQELMRGRTIDIYWMGTDKNRNAALRAIPIPLERGLMGYRQFVVHRKRVAEFEQVHSLAELQKFTACQGTHWPDTGILRAADLKVKTSTGYENLFKQIAAGRCDYFPRGFHEIRIEMNKRAGEFPELVAYEPLILHYPFAVYFFVRQDNHALAAWVQEGLEQMIDDGELLAHIQQHPHTRRAFPLARLAERRIINIPNDSLPDSADQFDARYWFQPADFIPSAKAQ